MPIGKTINDKIDELELAMQEGDAVDCPLIHQFVPGMYIREIFMPAGILVTSMIHNTNHPFFVMEGKVSVYSDNDGEQLIEAPYRGITTPGTRRVLFIHEDTIWVTVHPTDVMPMGDTEEDILEAVKKVESAILEKRPNPLLGGVIKNNIIEPQLIDNPCRMSLPPL
jgi:hypothetical protein